MILNSKPLKKTCKLWVFIGFVHFSDDSSTLFHTGFRHTVVGGSFKYSRQMLPSCWRTQTPYPPWTCISREPVQTVAFAMHAELAGPLAHYLTWSVAWFRRALSYKSVDFRLEFDTNNLRLRLDLSLLTRRDLKPSPNYTSKMIQLKSVRSFSSSFLAKVFISPDPRSINQTTIMLQTGTEFKDQLMSRVALESATILKVTASAY